MAILASAPGNVVVPAASVRVPTTLHVGSGKNFQPQWLNLDIDARWRPDFVFDIGQPLPADGQVVVETSRFGALTLGDEMFEAIVAQDVLEHIRDLTTAMSTMLRWLRTGGVLRIGVPYDLSHGAWCDPTHVRAFNERSFDYYEKWSWYLGWRTHNFAVKRMDFTTSPLGTAMQAEGRPVEEILRTPRAVDSIQVELQKVRLSPDARATTDWIHERPLH